MARTGRRPGATVTRERILEVAREEFADKGYTGASVRGIARAAGVDPALVHHFFGAKEQVFVAAMRLPYDPAEVLRGITASSSRHDRAEALLRFLLGAWEDPRTRGPLLALLRSAAAHDAFAVTVRGFLEDVLSRHIAERFEVPPLRATALLSQVFGLLAMRYVVEVEPLASATVDDIVAVYAPALRALIDADGAEPDDEGRRAGTGEPGGR
ncbi:TetR family transcriptional regulator [Marinactinospora endophytica]